MRDTKPLLLKTDFPPIFRLKTQIVQVNLGYLCNLSCSHCHVNAGPKRQELMDKQTIDDLLAYVDAHGIHTLDLTGGAPEMNPHFRYLVQAARARQMTVIDRCNLTILLEPGFETLAQFLADHGVAIVASLPCYSEENVDKQRGKSVFERSIKALHGLNALGYGVQPDLSLDLVYNPNGDCLPPNQQQLEADYKKILKRDYNIEFNQLLTITNMPISRFGSMLLAKGLYEKYIQLLKDNFYLANLDSLMCKTLISVDWQGYVYDCDFNQMLDMPLAYSADTIASDKQRWHIRELLAIDLANESIAIGEHCYGCTAGQGSSCGGALA
ncbi:MAG: arsenosugar biosynthesis radical SAM (seleno)protein ArsS [Pseudomonadota bacterium]